MTDDFIFGFLLGCFLTAGAVFAAVACIFDRFWVDEEGQRPVPTMSWWEYLAAFPLWPFFIGYTLIHYGMTRRGSRP